MKTKRVFVRSTTLILLASVGLAQLHAARSQVMSEATLETSLRAFSASSWNERAVAFYTILASAAPRGFRENAAAVRKGLLTFLEEHSQKSDQIKRALIGLLETENTQARPNATPRLTEQYTAYWGDVAGAVAALRDDRAIPALVAIISSGDLVTDGLAALGSRAVPAVVGRIDDPDPIVRQSVARMLSEVLDPAIGSVPTDPASTDVVKKALIHCAADSNEWVRVSALPGLGRLPGNDVTGLLRRIAETDPFVRAGRPGEPSDYYLVRERAKVLLQGRKERGPFSSLQTLPHCPIAPLPHCLIASLPHCLIASLPHCLIASLPHCLIAPLPHCPIAPLPHCPIAPLPHCLTVPLTSAST
jgi:hypothetical protein